MNSIQRLSSVLTVALLVSAAVGGPLAIASADRGGSDATDTKKTNLEQQAARTNLQQQESPAYARLDSGSTFWKGQTLWLSAGEANASEAWQLREWSDGSVGSLVTEFTLNESGAATLSTDGLTGQYVVVNQNQNPVVFRNGTVAESPGEGTPSFEIATQELNATFADDTVTNQNDDSAVTDLELDSNRGSYRVVLESPALSAAELTQIFAANQTDVDGDGTQEVVVTRLITGPTDALDADFTGVSPGTYTVNVSAVDGTASARATVEVRQSEPRSASFNQSVVTEEQGDVATIGVNLDGTQNATVVVGSEDVNYQSRVVVRDVDGDGNVTLRMNTFVAGRGVGETGGFTAAGADEILNYTLLTDPLQSPLDAGRYPTTLRLGENRTGVGALVLTEPSIGSAQVWTAPDAAQPENVQDVIDVVSRDDTIAREDWAIVQVEASGVYGYLNNTTDLNDTSVGLRAEITQTNAGANAETGAIPLDRVRLVTVPRVDQFFLVFDTNGLEPGTQYEASVTATEANPYFEQNRTASANFTIVERRVSVTGAANGPIQLVTGNATVAGNSTLAAGSEFTVSVQNRDGGEPFLRTNRVTVGPNGSWSTNFALPNVSNGTLAEVLVPDYNVSSDAILVEQIQDGQAGDGNQTTTAADGQAGGAGAADGQQTTTETTAAETTTTAAEETTVAETTAAGTTPTEETPTETTTEGGGDGGIPGFGIGVTLLALVVAALVALRRGRSE